MILELRAHAVRTTLALIVAAAATLTISGCSAPDSGSGETAPETLTSDDSTQVNEDNTDSAPSAGLGSLGSALEQTLGGIERYEVDGSVLRLHLDPAVMSSFDLQVVCNSTRQLAASLTIPEGSSAEAVLGTETLDCDI